MKSNLSLVKNVGGSNSNCDGKVNHNTVGEEQLAKPAERISKGKARIEELGMNPEDYWWYLNLRRFGGTQHAGFGLGFERMVMYLTGIANIRDVVPYPRTVGNCEY